MAKLKPETIELILSIQKKRLHNKLIRQKHQKKIAKAIKVVQFNNCLLKQSIPGMRCSVNAYKECKDYGNCLNIVCYKLNWPGWRLITPEEVKARGLHTKTFYCTNDGTIQEAKEVNSLGNKKHLILGDCRSSNKTG